MRSYSCKFSQLWNCGASFFATCSCSQRPAIRKAVQFNDGPRVAIPCVGNELMNSIDMEIFERQARICKAFAHPARLQILDLLGQGELGVSDLQEVLGISKTNMSQHMAVLKSVGVLSSRREGRQVYCSLALPEVKEACQLINRVLRAQIAADHGLIK